MRRALLCAVVGLVLAGCSGSAIEVNDVRLALPTGPNAALYFTASGEADRLLGATASVAASTELHHTTINDDGTTAMRRVETLEVGPDEPLVLQPGGIHLMLIDADRLEVGDTVEVVLRWETAGEMTVEAVVVEPNRAVGD